MRAAPASRAIRTFIENLLGTCWSRKRTRDASTGGDYNSTLPEAGKASGASVAKMPRCGIPATDQPAKSRACCRSSTRSSGSSRPTERRRRSEEHTSELQSLMRISYAVFCLKKKNETIHKCKGLRNEHNKPHKTCHVNN